MNRSLRASIRRGGKSRILSESPHFYRAYLQKGASDRNVGRMVAKIVDDTVKFGTLCIDWRDNQKTPVLEFYDPDNYALNTVSLIHNINETLEFYRYEEDAKNSRQYRFLMHMRKAVLDFARNERDSKPR